jgi:hypothetical protein
VQIVFISVGEIKLDHFFEKYAIFFKLCNKRLKCVKFLKTVYWCSLVNKYKSRYRLVVYGAMGFYLFTGDVGVRLCFCSVGVGALSYDFARLNYLVELWTVFSGKECCSFLLYVVRDE